MASQEKYTILYGRLSQEDTQKRSGKEDDSNSIQNQRLLLEKYAADGVHRHETHKRGSKGDTKPRKADFRYDQASKRTYVPVQASL